MAERQSTAAQPEWGNRLQAFREDVLQLSRAEFASLLNSKGGETKVNVSCGERLVTRWEQGAVKTPTAVYKRLLRAVGAPEAGNTRTSDTAVVSTVAKSATESPADERDFLGAIAAAAGRGRRARAWRAS